MKHKWLIALWTILTLAACSGKTSPSAKVIEGYFKALVAKDTQKAISLSCAAWEQNAQLDADTFANYPAKLDNIACNKSGQKGNFTLVACSGKLSLDYNGEIQEIDLADRVYLTVQEGGEWRMCGYK